jgi:hypothetical protein
LTHINDINTWDDYWKIFDDLCGSLKNQNKTKFIEELFFARLLVNGLTDGWQDFLNMFKQIYDKNANDLLPEDIERCKILIEALTMSLKSR